MNTFAWVLGIAAGVGVGHVWGFYEATKRHEPRNEHRFMGDER